MKTYNREFFALWSREQLVDEVIRLNKVLSADTVEELKKLENEALKK